MGERKRGRRTRCCRRGTGFGLNCFLRRFRCGFRRNSLRNEFSDTCRFGRAPLDADNILVRNLPAKGLLGTHVIEALFEEDGTAGISNEGASGGQAYVASTIMHFDLAPEKG